ncbi:MAG TPA: NB-ARC domain-containing protein [Stenomitos sp.]
MTRSLKIRKEWIDGVHLAIRYHGFSSQKDLAKDRQICLSTVNKFLRGKPIDANIFFELCHFLELNVKEVAEPGNIKQDLSNLIAPDLNLVDCGRQDWGEAVEIEAFYGRTSDLECLKNWVLKEQCRLVSIGGMGGIGKTALGLCFAKQVQETFDIVIWRSLCSAPSLSVLLSDLIQLISPGTDICESDSAKRLTSKLLQCFQQFRCLIVLDEFEALFAKGTYASTYQSGLEDYGYLLSVIAQSSHRSCLLVASREKPKEVTLFEHKLAPVRSLQLKGLTLKDGAAIFHAQEHPILQTQHWETVVEHYGGHPHALHLVAASWRESLGMNVDTLIEKLVRLQFPLQDLNSLLEQQFERLALSEQRILYLLGLHSQLLSLRDIAPLMTIHRELSLRTTPSLWTIHRESLRFPEALPYPYPWVEASQKQALEAGWEELSLERTSIFDFRDEHGLEILEDVRSLQRRGWVEFDDRGISLTPTTREYLLHRLIRCAVAEIVSQDPDVLKHYSLFQTTSMLGITLSYNDFITAAVIKQLWRIWGIGTTKHKLAEFYNTLKADDCHVWDLAADNVYYLQRALADLSKERLPHQCLALVQDAVATAQLHPTD